MSFAVFFNDYLGGTNPALKSVPESELNAKSLIFI